MEHNLQLYQEITNRITASPQQRITFAEYMELALYHPEYGYYSQNAANLGKEGDFFTSVHLGADFGEMLAIQFIQMWEILGKPVPFSLIEMGAGQGHLALDILNYIKQQYPDFLQALKYIIIEKSPGLKQLQQQRLKNVEINWCSLEEIKNNSVIGCFFSNELLDAFPVHQFILENGELREIYVTIKGEQETGKLFTEIVDKPSTPELVNYLKLLEIDISKYPSGYRSEINLAALEWLGVVANRLQRGYVLTIDYGYTQNRYYNPRRDKGTLQCYTRHHRHNDPYINIGQQDITAHVDFTALQQNGDRHGLQKIGLTQQGLFLMALGLGERVATLSQSKQPLSSLLQRRDSLHQLLDPLGLGGFHVLVQAKGLTTAEISQQLQGFIQPQ
ncbi:class I SAM-dependent methyltransferase [Plectonema cf. radiosum LEGE 06105]|uniref:Class I SAM-dependent methyltransferase n=1 Tax=Plectonema cf. radiosum LEGE 06105 TaxID=945769 RepID=A0A8J7K3X0_9CYAN|nr:class I SAM-dependent methyltransferase [Plectonema radiosum]MBE9216241.1 class I SAM-dependent methyltransferase [Plectonema cf. radiosum LEGE 06105]